MGIWLYYRSGRVSHCIIYKYRCGYVTFIEQKGECIIRYFGRPCDEFAERIWPIKISDGARVTLFNKGLVSCDVNQSFLILLFEWEYVSFMMISCIFCYRRYCMMWRHLAPPPLWVSWDIVWLLTIEKTRKHDTIQYYRRCMVGWLLFYVKGIWAVLMWKEEQTCQ